MTPSGFKLVYGIGGSLVGLGLLIIVVAEIAAAWFNRQKGDTITEIMRSLDLPGFIYVTAAIFIVTLALHLWGRWGL